jgi:hypothetical protein
MESDMIVQLHVSNNGRSYRFLLRKDHAGGLESTSLTESNSRIIHVMNARATDLIQDADKYLTPEQALKVKMHIALVAA